MGVSAARPPVSLDALIEALEIQSEELRAFVNPETAEVVLVSDEALEAAETPDGASDVDEAEYELARAVLTTPGFMEVGPSGASKTRAILLVSRRAGLASAMKSTKRSRFGGARIMGSPGPALEIRAGRTHSGSRYRRPSSCRFQGGCSLRHDRGSWRCDPPILQPEAPVNIHDNARLTDWGRAELGRRVVLDGEPVRAVATPPKRPTRPVRRVAVEAAVDTTNPSERTREKSPDGCGGDRCVDRYRGVWCVPRLVDPSDRAPG